MRGLGLPALTAALTLMLMVWAQKAAAFDIDNINILYFGDREDGSLQGYDFHIEVWGTGMGGMAGVRVEDEDNNSYNLTYNPEGLWEYEELGYADQAAVFAAHPNDMQYDFHFNEGQPDYDHDVLGFNVTPPGGFPDITYPSHNSTGVWLNPHYTWNSVAGVPNAVGLYMVVRQPPSGDELYDRFEYGLTRTKWQPGPLAPLTGYTFGVETVNAHGGAFQAETTDNGDAYQYIGAFEESNSVGFTTGTAEGPQIWLTVAASAQELGGQEWDRFTLNFECDNDIRLIEIAYNLGTAVGELFFDVEPHGGPGYQFTELAGSSPVGVTGYLSADNSPLLGIQCNDFEPGETLIFGIDVDGVDCSTFTAADFDNAYLGLLFDPSPAFPGADPFLINLYFDGTGINTAVPEPATGVLLVGGLGLLGLLRKRRLAAHKQR